MLTDLITLIVGYVLYFFCFVLIAIRLIATWARDKKWAVDDYWMLAAALVLVLRVVVTHLVLEYDTNNVTHPELLTPYDIQRRELGSKMALVARSCYATFIWCMKFCILALYTKIVEQLHEYQRFIKYIWVFLALTWFGVMASTLLECHPFNHYWQVYPNPGRSCTFAEGQLYTTGALNIATDLILIIYPLPMIFRTNLPLRRKLQLYTLFSLGFFVILVSISRLPLVIENNAVQRWRTLFASIEMLVACCVANAPVLYRIAITQAQKHSTNRTRSPTLPSQGYWFSTNRSTRRGRHDQENDEIEFAELGVATSTEEAHLEWGTVASTAVDSDVVESITELGKGSHEQERHQPV